jgi:serine/threonine protein kinase
MSFIPGANVGPYRIVEQVERHGVATAFTAYQPSLGRYVSVVVVPTIDRHDVALQRQYQRQIELTLSLRHPNILTVLDHGEHLGVSFVVTELLEVEPLADRLGAPWPLTEVVRILKPIAAGLDFAHGFGVVHGEMRPSMVLLTPDGTPILAGFGQSVRRFADAEGRPVVAEPGRLTPSIPAEIARAQAADRRGLALIAYEMLTGRSVDSDSQNFERPLPPAQIGSPLLSPLTERALLRELSGEPSERYGSASAFLDDLATAVPARSSTITSSLPPRPSLPGVRPPAGESRRRLITVAVIFTALAVLGSLALFLRGGEPSRPIAAVRTPTPATSTESAIVGGSSGTSATPATGAGGAGSGAIHAGGATPGGVTPSAGAPGPGAPAGAVSTRPGQSQVVVPTPLAGGAPAPTVAAGSASASTPVVPSSSASSPSAGSAPATLAARAPAGPTAPSKPDGGAPASTTTRMPVAWRVTGDPSGRWTYDEQGRISARAEEGASLLLFPESVEDVKYSALVSSSTCQATLVFRAQNDENLLMAIYIPDGIPTPTSAGGGVWLYQRVEGLDVPIRAVRPSTMKRAGEPVRLKVETNGSRIDVWLEDELAIQAVDTAPRSGKLGLMIYSAAGRQCEATFGDIQR